MIKTTTTLVLAAGLVVTALGGCGEQQEPVVTTTAETRSAAAGGETKSPAVERQELHEAWSARDATKVAAVSGPASVSPRMRVADRLMKPGAPKPVTDRATARAVLGAPLHVSAGGRVWSYLLSRRSLPGDECLRRLEVRLTADGRVSALIADQDEQCASDNQPVAEDDR
jgi:hypothetical protein